MSRPYLRYLYDGLLLFGVLVGISAVVLRALEGSFGVLDVETNLFYYVF